MATRRLDSLTRSVVVGVGRLKQREYVLGYSAGTQAQRVLIAARDGTDKTCRLSHYLIAVVYRLPSYLSLVEGGVYPLQTVLALKDVVSALAGLNVRDPWHPAAGFVGTV